MRVLDNYSCEGQMSIFDLFDQDTWSGKTSPEPSAPIKGKISDASLKKFAELRIKPPMYLCLKKENGAQAVSSWEMIGPLLGEYTMHSFGECPKEENVSRLSQILEDKPLPKYSLSAKACQGILNRAERREKVLPPLLKETLMRQARGAENVTEESQKDLMIVENGIPKPLPSKNEQDVMGGVKESLSNENEQEPYQPSTTNPSCLNPWDVQSKHIQPENGKAEALYSGECRGGGGESYVMQNTVYCLQGNGIDRAETAGCNGKGWKEDESYTLNTVDRHAICIGGQVNDAISPSEEVSKTLNCMDDPMKVMTFSDIHNALNARDGRSGVHSQMLNEPENNFVVCIGNGQTAQLKESDKVGTLNCMHEQQAIIVPKEPILLESNQDHATVQEDGVSTTLPASMGMGGGYVPMVTYSVDQGGGKSACKVDEEKSPTLTTTHDGAPAVCYGVDCYNQTQSQEVSKALNAAATDSDHIPCVYGIDRASFNQGKNALYDFSVEEEKAQTLVARGPGGGTSETVGALCARDYKGVGNQYVDEGKCIIHRI